MRRQQRTDLLRRQIEMIRRGIHRKARWPWIEIQRGIARFAVETLIFEDNFGGTEQFAGADAPAQPPFTRTSNKSAKSLSNSSVRSKLAGASP